MGRELQKRKNRSSTNRVRQKPKSKKKYVKNNIIAAHWDNRQSLLQNYTRIGLESNPNRLKNGSTGTTSSSLAIASSSHPTRVVETKISRDPVSGGILEFEQTAENMGHSSSDDELEGRGRDSVLVTAQGQNTGAHAVLETDSDAMRALKMVSSKGAEKAVRHPSQREIAWAKRLIDRHGDNYAAMSRDMKLNPMQQSTGDIRRRIRKCTELGNSASP